MMAEPTGDRLLRRTKMTRRELECYEADLVQAWRQAELDEEMVWRIRRAHRLRRHLGLDYDAIEIILRLVDRLERLEGGDSEPSISVRVIDG